MDLSDILMLLAVVLGPAFGAWLAIHLEDRRAKRERMLDIFRTLMRTRRTPVWQDHVGALNLVEIEFQEYPDVISKWKKLFEHFGSEHPRRKDEVVNDNMDSREKQEKENNYGRRLQQERQELLDILLHSIANIVGFSKIEQLEIFKGGYTPQGWGDVEFELTVIRRMFAQIALGHRMFPIGVVYLPGQNQVNETTEKDTTQASTAPAINLEEK